MNETTTFVGTKAAAAKRDRARAIPGVADRVATLRAEMAEEDRIYADNLAAIRRAAQLTQGALARVMDVNQSEVSRIERRNDLLLSTLASYLAAAGAHHTRIVSIIGGREVELDVDQLLSR
jgi:DNA-binding transcriptional regulator YiaG